MLFRSLELDPRRHEANVGGQPLELTPTEYRILESLLRANGDVVRREQLLRAGWPTEADPDPLWLKPHVARLRGKLEGTGAPAILPVRSVGYRLDVAARD